MGSPIKSPDGTMRVTDMKHAGQAGRMTRMTRVAAWLVNVAIPKLIPDQVTAPLRERARTPMTGWSEPLVGSFVARSREARQIPVVTPGEQHSQVAESDTAKSPESDTALQSSLEENVPYVGPMTRLISWAVDFLLINLVAIITGLGAELIVGIFPITKNLKPALPGDRRCGLRSLDGSLLRRILVGNGPDARFSPDASSVSDGERREGQASPLHRDEPRDGAVAVGLRADPVQAPGIPGLACPHARDRGPTAVDRRCSTGTVAGRTRQITTNTSSRRPIIPSRV